MFSKIKLLLLGDCSFLAMLLFCLRKSGRLFTLRPIVSLSNTVGNWFSCLKLVKLCSKSLVFGRYEMDSRLPFLHQEPQFKLIVCQKY